MILSKMAPKKNIWIIHEISVRVGPECRVGARGGEIEEALAQIHFRGQEVAGEFAEPHELGRVGIAVVACGHDPADGDAEELTPA